jgi:ABC-2 type transport system ATP-binding protein
VPPSGLEVVDLAKSYGRQRVFSDVSLHAEHGEVLALLGPNGAGKTTIVSIIAGLRQPDAGTVHALGVDVLRDPRRIRPVLGLAAQNVAIYPTHTVNENLRFFGRINGLWGRRLTVAVDELVETLDLGETRHRLAGTLSTGQQRRLHTACALVHRPSLILLDEPTVGADAQSRAGLVAFVARLAADGAIVLYTTHYLTEVENLASRVVIIGHGQVLASGTVNELIARHSRSEVVLRIDGPVPDIPWPGAIAADGVLRLPADDPAMALVRAVDAIGEARHRLRGVELVRANLEQAYTTVLERHEVTV